jgi:predicted porin
VINLSLPAPSQSHVLAGIVPFDDDFPAAYYIRHDTNPIPTSVATGLNNNRFYDASALYSTNGFTVSTSFSNGRNRAHASTTNFDMISGGFGYRFTPAFEVTSSVYYIKDENNSANKSIKHVVGANYSLCKATSFYAQVGYVDNYGKMNQSIEYGQLGARGANTMAAMVGIRKLFCRLPPSLLEAAFVQSNSYDVEGASRSLTDAISRGIP